MVHSFIIKQNILYNIRYCDICKVILKNKEFIKSSYNIKRDYCINCYCCNQDINKFKELIRNSNLEQNTWYFGFDKYYYNNRYNIIDYSYFLKNNYKLYYNKVKEYWIINRFFKKYILPTIQYKRVIREFKEYHPKSIYFLNMISNYI